MPDKMDQGGRLGLMVVFLIVIGYILRKNGRDLGERRLLGKIVIHTGWSIFSLLYIVLVRFIVSSFVLIEQCKWS